MTSHSIVVGLDESSSSRAALEWAARHARLTGSVLRAVHVLDWPYGLDEADVEPPRSTGPLLTDDQIESLYRGRITSVFDEVRPLPDWLMQTIEATCPLEDRVPERKVFHGMTEASAYQAMSRACKNAKVPHYHPHDLRHRRITIWHQSGVPARELAERAGHTRPSMSLDVYSHVMPPDELAPERVMSLLTEERTVA